MRTFSISLVALSIAVSCPHARVLGQTKDNTEPTGIFQTRQEYYDFMGAVKASSADSPELAAMIPLINDVVLNRQPGSTAQQYGVAGGNLDVLADPEVRKEIEMVDDQYRDLERAKVQIQRRLADELRQIDFSKTSAAEIAEHLRGLQKSATREIESVLLPHQMERLRQLVLQSQLRQRSLVDILTSQPLRNELKITPEQADGLREAEQEIEAELAREMEKLRERARTRLLERLTLQQREKVRDLFGTAFEFQYPKKNPRTGSKETLPTKKLTDRMLAR